MSRARRGGAATAAAGLLVTAAACSSGPDPAPPARAFLGGWERGDDAAAGRATDAPDAAAAALGATRRRLGVQAATLRLTGVRTSGDTATAAYTARLTLRALGVWNYSGALALRKADGRWTVHWVPSALHPRLAAGQVLGRTRTLLPRAAILDAAGVPLTRPTPVVTVSILPSALRDRPGTVALLANTLGVDGRRLGAALASAPPARLLPVITLRRSDYEKVRASIYAVPGLRFPSAVQQLAPTPTFARQVLGRVGPATAQALAAAGPAYQDGDDVGLSGLQSAYQSRLAGIPVGAVVIRDAAGPELATLQTFPGQPGQPVRTTLDRRLQTAAEAALTATRGPAALVAVRPSTGAVLATANTPGDSGYNRAFVGRYPPGSTFKIVTTAALLARGLRPDEPVACPPTLAVEGKVFRNFEGEAAGRIPFRQDFAISCNTAFVALAPRLPGDALPVAARDLGIGGSWTLPLSTYAGSVPTPASAVEQAAAVIGQGRVTVSPLSLALVAAAVSAGTWRPPVLVTDPAAPRPGPSGPDPPSAAAPGAASAAPGASGSAASNAATPGAATPGAASGSASGSRADAVRPVPVPAAAELRTLMRGVVTAGTAAAAFRSYSGPPVSGKTGTAEYGTGRPPRTHAWFVGFQPGRDLAFAVLVENGASGGSVAAPVAVRFLQRAG